ncbi:MAG: tetratricopeptide repeat protein [Chloroflexia bacterium]|nr:tetratricopeptide repeat protein [Chloroflexia bacterium]
MKLIYLALLVIFSSCSLIGKVGNKKTSSLNSEESSVAYNYAFTEATKQKLFGNYSQALALLFKCIEVNPTSSATYYLISEIYLKNGQPEKALDYCRLAVRYDNENNWYRLDLATLYKMNNKIDSTIYQYKIIVKNNPHNFRYAYNLAALYFEYGELWKSLKIIRKLSDDDKKNEELVITKFQIERKLKKYKSAERTLKRISKQLPDDFKFLGLLAEHYKSIGKIEKGERTYRELLKRDSLNEIGVIGLATFYLETKRIYEAEDLIRKRLLFENNISENEILFLANSLKIDEISQPFKIQIVKLVKNWIVLNPVNDIDIRNLSEILTGTGFTKDASEILEFLYLNNKDFKDLDVYLMVLNLEDNSDRIQKITSDFS